jgi:phosphoribosylglycinamide formyltransferase-1
MRKRVAILISGRGSNMAALIEAGKAPDYPAEIVLVLSNIAEAQGLARARDAASQPKWSSTSRSARIARLSTARCMRCWKNIASRSSAWQGFLRLLTPWFVERWSGRLINIHPSLLPAFKGLDTHARALAAGAKQHGATVHYVVPELDSGPVIAQESVAVLPDDTGRYARGARARGRAPHLSARAQACRGKHRDVTRTNTRAARPGLRVGPRHGRVTRP